MRCEDDLVIDDLECEDFEEEVKKTDKIVLVRKTEKDRENERILV